MHRLYWHYGVFFVFLLTLWYHVAPAVLEVLKGVASALSASSRMMGLWHPKSKVPAWSSVHSLSVTPPMKLSLSAASEGCPPICRHHQVLRHLMYCSSLLLFLPSFGLIVGLLVGYGAVAMQVVLRVCEMLDLLEVRTPQFLLLSKRITHPVNATLISILLLWEFTLNEVLNTDINLSVLHSEDEVPRKALKISHRTICS